ncbi:hypothetical protein [Vitiosangium sp. GDMCC 1.1324]|uniref:hypothetical protein n=1 Tax=Vitiosangium sp. (strain GDMCC 1.1324) TaxID=2138576 RepID=UPI000D366326|nr:hypothetical protein [Vitiosangium sp. GDMCC 1.1324]PTL83274.1 hypothetical protein DAT35_14900 [Vitiosangium sp. GDMCC 1.1324]
MRKLWVVGAFALGITACEQSVIEPPPTDLVVAQFDPAAVPPIVPTPNDLAINPKTGLVEAPVDPSAPPAQQEFTRDYLNTLDGFPTSAVAGTAIADVDPATLSPSSVVLLDLKPEAKLPAVTPVLGYDSQKGLLTVTPPASGWPKGGHYAVAVIGGANGVKGTGGKKVVASPAWALLRFPTPLVSCKEGVERTPDTCHATTNVIPSTEKDELIRIKDQAATALRLEALRVQYAPVLDALEAKGIKRDDVALLWTFTVMSLPEVVFDPDHSVVPFPFDLLRDSTGTHVELPIPENAPAEVKALYQGLNQLDGFSTTSPIVSENSDTRGAIDVGKLDASLLTAATRFLRVTATGAVPQPGVDVCLDCKNSKKADGTTPTDNPSQLQFVPRLPLSERTTYAVVLTSGLKNEQGKRVVPAGAFALLRSSAPLVDASKKSLVSGVTDDQALKLEAGRQKLKLLIDGLVAGGIPRKDLTLAWAFTTQSTVSTLKALHNLPTDLGADPRLPDAPKFLVDASSTFFPKIPHDHISKVLQGELVVPFALTGPGGILPPNLLATKDANLLRYDRVPFLLVLPSSTAPAAGYPVTLFGHGLRGNHQHVLAIADTLAATGRAVIAVDTVKHGQRSMCVGSAVLFLPSIPTATDDFACADPTKQRCDNEPASPTYGRCIARPGVAREPCIHTDAKADLTCSALGQGRCLADDTCEGGTFRTNTSDGSVTISGWNMLDLQNFFVTRDNFRHQVIDLAQVVRVLKGDAIDEQLTALGAPTLDGTRIDYVGGSLGGILGTLYTSVSPDVHRAVLNVPGGRLTQLLDEATASDFVNIRSILYSTLASKQMPQGSPAFDTFVRSAQWILDPGDPVNYSWYVSNGAGIPADREALVQYITRDKVVPNSSTLALINAANARGGSSKLLTVTPYDPSDTDLPGDSRHGFLMNNANPSVTQQAQLEVFNFLTKP